MVVMLKSTAGNNAAVFKMVTSESPGEAELDDDHGIKLLKCCRPVVDQSTQPRKRCGFPLPSEATIAPEPGRYRSAQIEIIGNWLNHSTSMVWRCSRIKEADE